MKEGMTLTELATELDRQKNAKRDFVAPANKVTVTDKFELNLGNELFPMTDLSMRQMAEWAKIPARYVDTMRQNAPDLLLTNLNRWLADQVRGENKRMIRVLDDRVRAWLSDRYRTLDNYDLAAVVLPILVELGAEVHSCQVTERKMYIKAVLPGREEKIGWQEGWKEGSGHNMYHVLKPGVTITNSEVGLGAWQVGPGIWTRHCTNLMTMSSDAFRKAHLGRSQSNGEDGVREVYSDETKALEDQTVLSKAKDIVTAALDGPLFEKYVQMAREAKEDKVHVKKAEGVIEELAKDHTEDVRGNILQHLIEGGDLSRFGVQAAVTRASQDVESYDIASDLETLGGRIIELPQTEWQRLAA